MDLFGVLNDVNGRGWIAKRRILGRSRRFEILDQQMLTDGTENPQLLLKATTKIHARKFVEKQNN